MTSPLDRVRMLLERAAKTTFEEEARTSALLAARLIATNGFVVTDGRSSKPLIQAPTGRPAPRPNVSTSAIQTGNYDVELISGKYDWFGSHCVQLEFMIEESYGIWNDAACGQTYTILYDFELPYKSIVIDFVRASKYDLFKYPIDKFNLEEFCETIRNTKYGVTIENRILLQRECINVINYFPYGTNGNLTGRRR